ncbi:hypothetical protein D0Z07_7238 [Hyphodiscus hymeniophilus]|uniref:Uncharacterized protein n=1 Tax=Hyphodiscus hymeniophilus TaxID=353542 RepID=A0A9P6VGN0_9HELO|nr:hypothetical protein D0Z07_7238 [Hyphodiscus hymeniophilus]
MAGAWEHHRPPRTRWQSPGIFLNVEFGVSFSPNDRTHTTGVHYTSRRMEDRLHQERMRNRDELAYNNQEPGEQQLLATLGALMPGPEAEFGYGYEAEDQSRHQQQQRQRRLGTRTREQHGRGTSAPPSLTERTRPESPVNYIPHIAPIQHTRSMPLDRTNSQEVLQSRTNQPLPPTPSQFRLGEADMPWSMPAWYRSPEQPDSATPSIVGMDEDNYRNEDPDRVRQLETLQQAMMTVDSQGQDEWEPWTWDSVGEIPRGPRSIGWAVSSHVNSRDGRPISPPIPAPPPYVVSQWEQACARAHATRPRSSYS